MDKKPQSTDTKTSWGNVAEWYDEHLEDSDDSYQKKVLLPNLIRIVDPKPGMTIFDIACGQGYFARAFYSHGANVQASDISGELVGKAKDRLIQEQKNAKNPVQKGSLEYHITSADKLSFAKDATADVAVIVLAIQNIENIAGTMMEASRVLKSGGKLVIILNHPAYRIPQSSSWQWDEKQAKQYRRIDAYMSDQTFRIDMTPGEKNSHKKEFTVSFHRPLQSYFKAFNKAGLSVVRLEEWISHKQSQKGPKAAEEDRIRKEIPMFMCIEAKK